LLTLGNELDKESSAAHGSEKELQSYARIIATADIHICSSSSLNPKMSSLSTTLGGLIRMALDSKIGKGGDRALSIRTLSNFILLGFSLRDYSFCSFVDISRMESVRTFRVQDLDSHMRVNPTFVPYTSASSSAIICALLAI
jgi:hypothetical protein